MEKRKTKLQPDVSGVRSLKLGSGKHIFLVCGSVRQDSRTRSAMNLIVDELQKEGASVKVFEPKDLQLPFLGSAFPPEVAGELQRDVAKADGLILCTPEYNGSFSAVLMAILENLGYPAAYAGKPVNLIGVAAGSLGATKALEHLRSVCFHNGALVLPSSISISEAHAVFDEEGHCLRPDLDLMIRTSAQSLLNFLASGKISQFGIKKL
ncbi:MAG: NAD(P)H-dependent oxidoreductase [Oligoflexales bacterium]|nr:NAD(P)H-dependent oxidoreductase [Oligoflexales bacterium]